jgi:hypothetical protein
MPRAFLIFALCLPLAVLMGFMLSDPLVGTNMAVSGVVIMMLATPLIINYHHRLLIWSSLTLLTAYFLKGQPQFWMIFALGSLALSLVSRPLAKVKPKPLWTPSLMWASIFFIVVILGTAKFAGGIGVRVLGSDVYGGRRYVSLLMAFVGLAALAMQRVPSNHVKTDLAVFTLGPATSAFSNIAYMLGPNFYFLFLIFPVDMALDQASFDMAPGFDSIRRLNGFAPACGGIVSYCLMRWGARGMLQLKPWRHALFLFGMACGMTSGFRSTLAVPLLLCVVQFFVEGLHRTRYVFALIGTGVVTFGLLLGFSESLPIVAQRALSFLPIKVDAAAQKDADASIEWRLEMWKIVIKDVPTYLWLGKGYAIDPKDLYLAEESMKRGFAQSYDFSIKAGDYHNGPLSVIIPFGIWGVIGFIWFSWESLRILWNNMRYGDQSLRVPNIFLFSSFLTRLLFFLFFYGGFSGDIWVLAATTGVGLSINGGMATSKKNPRLEYKRAPQPLGTARQFVEA